MTTNDYRDLAPEIVRQRLIVEGFYRATLTRETVAEIINRLATRLHRGECCGRDLG